MEQVINIYETLFIVDVTAGEEATKASVEKFASLIAANGEIVEQAEWGKRRLAYEIRKQSEGYYYFIKVDAVPSMAVELEKSLRLMNETVLRYLIVREGE